MKNLRYSLSILISITCVFLWSCSNQQKVNMPINKTKDNLSKEGYNIVSAPIVFKNFIKKDGTATERKEMYLQRSIQDYYIKFCESNVSREEIENYLSKIDNFIKVLTLEVEFLNGNWDICDDNLEQQSRIGEYVIIHRIIG